MSWCTPLAVAGAIVLLAGGCGGSDEASAPLVSHAPAPSRSTTPDAATGPVVDVSGHVRRPGVYRLHEGARVFEAIAAARGTRPGANLTTLNRAAEVVDGQQVVVPGPDGPAPAAGGAATPATGGSGARVSLNGADVAAFDALPGIGPVTAQKLVDDRAAHGPFESVDDLDRVPGIGPATIEALRDVVQP